MSIFKCKMCGGALEINNNESVATCEYCGTQQTLPKLDDDRRANLYDRANHFRRNNEFDKAMSIYEQILNEDNTDSEAYWSLVLCRYGIEYVEDPSSHKRIPTVNRAQFTSVFDDDNYKSALQYADGYQKFIYEEEAKAINEIQKGILAISQKEEPFDVFICYKESDNNGRRTPDSVLANDLYHQLTQEGFKVFFARITLEDKLGTAYEPYIFAALNSAKVMVVLGTKPEFFNAVWVKNEWSRYLALIKNGANKMLIPAYKDMDPYDLPEEFSHLQAQDMSKLGFMQDLIRGIKKIAKADELKQTVVKEAVVSGANVNTAPLLERAFMFLEDGNWDSADEYCEKVLDIDPKCAEAYLGKLMVELNVHKEDELRDCKEPFDSYDNYIKTMRFADSNLKGKLEADIEHILTRNENDRLKGIYARATQQMNTATTENNFKSAASTFDSISEFKDAKELRDKCLEKAEIARKDEILSDGKRTMSGEIISNYESAIKLLETISGWKDADEQIYACQKKIEEIKANDEARRLEKERQEQITKAEKERIAKRNKKIALIVTPSVCVLIAVWILWANVIHPNMKYNDALDLMKAEKYEEAIGVFEALKGYKESAKKIDECKYNKALDLMKAEKYEEAMVAFKAMKYYRESAKKMEECNTALIEGKYNKALELMEAGKIVEAYETLIALDGYKDSADKANSIYGKYFVEKNKNIKVGDYVKFGTYEQDNYSANGKEEIEWLVLEVEDGKALVISKYILDFEPYDTRYENATWETCSLRAWLNNGFITLAFSAKEREMIPTVTVSADKNPKFGTNPGNATQDQVFLLSITEANEYFNSDSARQCKLTDYADSVAPGYMSESSIYWWLRTPGWEQSDAAVVTYDGSIYELGPNVGYSGAGVRPALWIDLNS